MLEGRGNMLEAGKMDIDWRKDVESCAEKVINLGEWCLRTRLWHVCLEERIKKDVRCGSVF